VALINGMKMKHISIGTVGCSNSRGRCDNDLPFLMCLALKLKIRMDKQTNHMSNCVIVDCVGPESRSTLAFEFETLHNSPTACFMRNGRLVCRMNSSKSNKYNYTGEKLAVFIIFIMKRD